MKNKRGQVAIFLIIGLFMLLLIIAFLVLKDKIFTGNLQPEMEKMNTGMTDKELFNNFVEACLDKVSSPLIFKISEKGGSFNPKFGVTLNNSLVNVFAEYESGKGYVNKVVLKEEMESELAQAIKINLDSCLDFTAFESTGYKITRGDLSVNVNIDKETVTVNLISPMKVIKGAAIMEFSDFSSSIALPLGKLFLTAVDITNQEIQKGYFDKEQFMLEQGLKIAVEKHKPYPNIVYQLSTSQPKSNKELIFNFAIQGKDTVGKEVLSFDNAYGCCKDQTTNICYKNTDPGQCTNLVYLSDTNCQCDKQVTNEGMGCCETNNKCQIVNQKECLASGGNFSLNDLRCSKFGCNNLNCDHTYNYVTDDFSSPGKSNGESWCSYESIVGGGVDYVGTRHYLHSCINGVEYVEECRDYREELCTEGIIGQSDRLYSTGRCRINRWYDCVAQNNKDACNNDSIRDCSWADFLYSQKKCHPEVAPGLKFWDNSNEKICNIASLNKNEYGFEFPISWEHSTLLECQRSGDCGNYRNIADDLSVGGYYNKDGTPQQWAYWPAGYNKRGNDYVVRLDLDKTNLSSTASIPSGLSGGDAKCDLWKAPTTDKCDLCNSSKMHPCTEYRCRSLGRDCIFSEQSQECITSGLTDETSPTITLDYVQPGFNYEVHLSNYYSNAVVYTISPKVSIHKPFNLSFSTSTPTRCKISMNPPGVDPGLFSELDGSIPEILLNTFNYTTGYNVTIRFPSSNFTGLTKYLLFLRCYDESGRSSENEVAVEINTEESLNDRESPEVLSIDSIPKNLSEVEEALVSIFVNKPFNSCKYSVADATYPEMVDLNCSTTEEDILYEPDSPTGSYLCKGLVKIPNGANQLMFACEDTKGNINTSYIFNLS